VPICTRSVKDITILGSKPKCNSSNYYRPVIHIKEDIKMNFRGVGITVWKARAYLPSYAQHKSGTIIQVDPVYVTGLNEAELSSAVEKVLSSDIKVLPNPTKEEWKKRKDPLLAATGAKSWLELARKGGSYGIEWIPQGIRLDISRVDKKGRWEIDPAKVQIFKLDTPIKELIKVILDDVRTKPNLLQG
jgi:hypothetical protein